jgi:hypothetical protein
MDGSSVVVVGGGSTGVETAGALTSMARTQLTPRPPIEKATDVAGARYGAAAEIRSPANLAPRSQMPGGRK